MKELGDEEIRSAKCGVWIVEYKRKKGIKEMGKQKPDEEIRRWADGETRGNGDTEMGRWQDTGRGKHNFGGVIANIISMW